MLQYKKEEENRNPESRMQGESQDDVCTAGLRASQSVLNLLKQLKLKNHVHEIVLMTIKTGLKMNWA